MLVGGAAVYMVLRGAPRLAIWAVTTVIVGGVIGLAVKVAVERARPMLPDPVSWAPGWSFPSGHALNAALGAVTLVLVLLPVLHGVWRVVAWIAAALVSLTVAFTRVALGVHWVSDVVAGIILALVVVVATAAGFEAWRSADGPQAGRTLTWRASSRRSSPRTARGSPDDGEDLAVSDRMWSPRW